MAATSTDYTHPVDVQQELRHLQEDYTLVEGKPFRYFFCPLLWKDEPTRLCMAHIVNDKIADSCGKRVVQRHDVDNLYGTAFEDDFTTFVKVRGETLWGVVANPALSRKIRPRITVDGEDCEHYRYEGHAAAQHAPLILEGEKGSVVHLVLRKSPKEVEAALGKKWGIAVEGDYRLPALVALIKAAYLTLFRILGYRYALSLPGTSVGYDILGRFYRETGGDVKTARAEGSRFFKPYINMMRPMHITEGEGPRGTIEDYKCGVAFGSSGRPFALLVIVRTSAIRHMVLMPAFVHAESVATYQEFLTNDKEWIRVNDGEFDPEKGAWNVSEQSVEIFWPKHHESFALE